MSDWVLNTPLSCPSMFERIFSMTRKFLVHIEIIAKLENAGKGRSLKIPRKSDDNHPTLIKIGSINGFKS